MGSTTPGAHLQVKCLHSLASAFVLEYRLHLMVLLTSFYRDSSRGFKFSSIVTIILRISSRSYCISYPDDVLIRASPSNTMLLLHRITLLALLLIDLCFGATPNLPFGFQELFKVQLSVGKILRPLDIPGGTLVNEPITGGTVSGPALNGTIISGFAHPSFYGNGTLQVNIIDVYGVTDDGKSFYINQQGIGFGTKQITRIVRGKILFPSSSPCLG